MAREPIKTRTQRSSLLEGRYVESGMIQPGAHPEFEHQTQFNLKGLGRRIAGLFRPRTEMTPEENESAKLAGQKAYYEGKLKRLGKK